MKSEITELELLLDKLNLVWNEIKADGHIDTIEAALFLKYIRQLEAKVASLHPDNKISLQETTPVIDQKQEPVVTDNTDHSISTEQEKRNEININAFENAGLKKELTQENKKQAGKKEAPRKFIKVPDEEDEEGGSGLNKKLSKDKKTIADSIVNRQIKDLTTVVDLNERIYFTRHLFKGDSQAFDKSIRDINAFGTEQEAVSYIENELVSKLSWSDEEAIARFKELPARKFNP